MHAVRQHILEILKERSGATVADLADALEMAAVSVRHHLDILQGDNLICVERVERNGAVGRPQQIYALTEEAAHHFPNNFATLASNLVRQIKLVLPHDQVECVFRSMARDLAGELKSNTHDVEPIELRLERVIDFLNEHGYLASWEPDAGDAAGGYLLHKHNCPYAGVSSEHRELCLMDETLVDALFARPCQRVQHMVTDGHCCTYRIPDQAYANEPAQRLPVMSARSSIALVA